VVGYNHHFGHQREGSFEYLHELGHYYAFEVEEIPEQDLENEAVSSTRIRKALREGQIQRANAYLDHLFMMMGPLEPLDGYPIPGQRTFMLRPEEEEKLVPPPGSYACGLDWGKGEHKALAVVPSGGNLDGKGLQVILPGELEGSSGAADITLLFRKRLRGLENTSATPWQDWVREDLQTMNELIY
ncbi:MAG: hypothetical protein IH599_05090, partial [Bacteroidales bacterium]|nr:hypothetical protein [Bacteroidales bacterium]